MKSPTVDRKALLFLAGVVWTAVGLVLCTMAVYWLVTTRGNWILPLTAGIVVGVFIYYFGFSRLVKKNKARIYMQAPGKSQICLFAFQSWQSYFIIIVMMALGNILRHLSISRLCLVPIYLAIGIGLFLASLHYYSTAL
jgi:hypothetical protein